MGVAEVLLQTMCSMSHISSSWSWSNWTVATPPAAGGLLSSSSSQSISCQPATAGAGWGR